ncbi:MAG: U32 family peptidase [Methanobrevibacter sp.]|jgi:putative protease|nr:U32 family peptidase [Candidatus Methanovirga australis]
MVELLAPAGNLSSFNSALKNGANSIYIGLSGSNMRDNASNFNVEDLKSLTNVLHEQSKKLYLCTNTIMKDDNIKEIETILPEINSYEVDALIVSDLGMVDICVENGLNVHISVQSNVTNLRTLKILKRLGVSRTILSRELSFDEIEKIAKYSPIETEVFVHGAMCMGISGRCFLSYGLYGESANCGKCLQPCRKEWKLSRDYKSLDEEDIKKNSKENNNGHNKRDIEENDKGDIEEIILTKSYDKTYKTNFLSAKDLTMIEYIPELIKSGVEGFKIEGRGRSPDYVATATRIFREAIDQYNLSQKKNEKYEFNPKWLSELKKVFHRGFDTGFYFSQPYKISKDNVATHKKKDIGKVVNYYNKIKVGEIQLWDELSIYDEIIIQGNTTGSINQIVESMEINGKAIEKVEKGKNVAIAIKDKVRKNDHVYKLIRTF